MIEIIGIIGATATLIGLGFMCGKAFSASRQSKVHLALENMQLEEKLNIEDEDLRTSNALVIHFAFISAEMCIGLYYSHLISNNQLLHPKEADQVCGHFHLTFGWLQLQDDELAKSLTETLRKSLEAFDDPKTGIPLPEHYYLQEIIYFIDKNLREKRIRT